MSRVVLDSTPLGLLLQKSAYPKADACPGWLDRLGRTGRRIMVPNIIDYEVRRELLRLRLVRAIKWLDQLYTNPHVDRLPVTPDGLLRAAVLWAHSRRGGSPTADPHALDIDVILAAQVLSAGWPPGDFVVATSNVSHLSQFVPAAEWTTIA